MAPIHRSVQETRVKVKNAPNLNGVLIDNAVEVGLIKFYSVKGMG
jgi:hypothetical protein